MTIEELEKKMAELDELQAETENAHVKLKAQMAELEKLQAETENAHAKLIAQMAELHERGEEKPEPPHPRPYPERQQKYFYVNPMGKVVASNWLLDQIDLDTHEIGNVFFGKTAADFAVERLKVLAEMREWAGSWDDGVALKYDGTNKLISTIFIAPRQYTFGEMRFYDRKDAENCIKAVGEDRIKKYYFMIPEDAADDD